jgi:DNA-binding FrmR family transcriptional regulator
LQEVNENVDLSRRIAHVEGRVKAIRKMIEEKTYLETGQQISAVG